MAKLLTGTRVYGTATIDTQLIVSGTVASTSTTTGALTVAGGAGIRGNLYVGGTIFQGGVAVGTGGSGSATTASNVQTVFSTTNAAHFLTFVDSNNATATGEVLYTTSSVTVNPRTGEVDVLSTLASTSTTTGALVVTGGVGVGGNLYVGGEIVSQRLTIQLTTITTTLVQTDDIIRTTNTTASTSTTTGALQVAGGVGVGGNLYVGGSMSVAGDLQGTGTDVTITAGAFTSTFSSTGPVTLPNNLNVTGNLTVTGTINGTTAISVKNIYEAITNISGATGVVTHNAANGQIFNHTSIANTFTANFTNLGLSAGFVTNTVLILNQGATAYIPTGVQIAGAAQTINWQNGSVPSGSANKRDIVSFSFTNIGGTYTVFGQLVSFG